MRGQLHAQPPHVHRLLPQPRDLFQGFDRIACGDRIADLKQILPVGHARHAAHQRFVHSVGNTGAGVQDRERVAHRAVGQASDQLGRRGVKLDLFLPGHIFEPPGNVFGRDARKVVPLAARKDGGGDLLHFGGRQDEDDVLGRFLHRFEQRVEGRRAQHVHLVDDIHLVAAHGGQIGGLVAQVADIVDAVVGSGVDLRNIQHGALVNALAHRALAAGVRACGIQAVDRLGKDLCAGGLAGAARAGEQISVADAPGGDLVLQRRHNGLLAHHVGKAARPPFAV